MYLRIAFVTLLSVIGAAQGSSPKPSTTLVKAGRLLDVRAAKYLPNQGVLIENDKIKEVDPLASVQSHAFKDTLIIDIIANAGDPLEDITGLERVRFVMKGGAVVKNEVEKNSRATIADQLITESRGTSLI